MKRRLLLTGRDGFLGQYVVKDALQKGCEILAIDRVERGHKYHPKIRCETGDLSLVDIGALVADFKPTDCIHCAGRSSVPDSVVDPEGDFAGGPYITSRLLGSLRRYAPMCRFVLLSSAAVYGNPTSLPISERSKPEPISPYGWHKLQSELLCLEYNQVYGLPTAAARVFSAYGPGLTRQVIWDICRKALEGGELLLQGTGDETRDFIHAADVALALGYVLEGAPMKGEAYNVGSGKQTSIRHLSWLILDALGLDTMPTFDGVLPEGVPARWHADITAIEGLGFSPSMDFLGGIAGCVEFIRNRLGSRAENT